MEQKTQEKETNFLKFIHLKSKCTWKGKTQRKCENFMKRGSALPRRTLELSTPNLPFSILLEVNSRWKSMIGTERILRFSKRSTSLKKPAVVSRFLVSNTFSLPICLITQELILLPLLRLKSTYSFFFKIIF